MISRKERTFFLSLSKMRWRHETVIEYEVRKDTFSLSTTCECTSETDSEQRSSISSPPPPSIPRGMEGGGGGGEENVKKAG